MSEKNPTKLFENSVERSPEQQRQNIERQERLREDVERKAERSKAERGIEESVERRTAERLAKSTEQPAREEVAAEKSKAPKRQSPSSRRERDQAYDSIMSDAREHMSPTQKAFSKVIHHRAVESTSNAVGVTVARPNAILAGSFTAFIVVLGVFLVARHYGYPLSGSESIVAFAGGWVLGLMFDYLRTLITGRH